MHEFENSEGVQRSIAELTTLSSVGARDLVYPFFAAKHLTDSIKTSTILPTINDRNQTYQLSACNAQCIADMYCAMFNELHKDDQSAIDTAAERYTPPLDNCEWIH